MAFEMKSEVKDLSPVERELSIIVAGTQVAKELDKAYRQLSQKVRLKGYRPGKIPRYILEQYYKSETEQDVLQKVVGTSFREAVKSHSLVPVSEPKIQATPELIPGMDFSYSATIEIKPEFDLQKYKGLALSKKKYTVDDAAVMRQLEAMRERMVRVEPVEDRDLIQQGDLVEANYSGTVDGENMRGLGGVSFVIEVGAGRFFAEAEQALVGKKLGEPVVVDVSVPDDHRVVGARGKTASLTIKPNEIKKKVAPDINDDFAKEISDEVANLDELKVKVRENIEMSVAAQNKTQLRDAALDALIEANPFEVPKSLVERQAQQIAVGALQRMPRQHAERVWTSQGDKMTEQARPRALRTVRGGLLLEKLIEVEGIEVAEAKLDEKLEEIAVSVSQTLNQVKKIYQKQGGLDDLRHQIASETALDRVIEFATITEVEESAAALDVPLPNAG